MTEGFQRVIGYSPNSTDQFRITWKFVKVGVLQNWIDGYHIYFCNILSFTVMVFVDSVSNLCIYL